MQQSCAPEATAFLSACWRVGARRTEKALRQARAPAGRTRRGARFRTRLSRKTASSHRAGSASPSPPHQKIGMGRTGTYAGSGSQWPARRQKSARASAAVCATSRRERQRRNHHQQSRAGEQWSRPERREGERTARERSGATYSGNCRHTPKERRAV